MLNPAKLCYSHVPVDSDFIQGVKNILGGDDKKELVDPYFVFSFAGQEVRSKIMYNSDHPEWNRELRLGLRVSYF